MDALLTATFRALRSLFVPGMVKIFLLSVVITIGVLFAFVALSSLFFTWLSATLPEDVAAFVPLAGSFGAMILAWLLFPGIMPVIVNFFDDRIARLIERADYPAAEAAHPTDFWKELWHDARFSALVIIANMLVLPLYLLPPIFPFVFYPLNGYLLGREFFIMAARRHMSIENAHVLRRAHRGTILIAGMALTLLATLPILNWFAPFWGVAVMVHLYHRLTHTETARIIY